MQESPVGFGACALGAAEYRVGLHGAQGFALRHVWWCVLAIPLVGGALYTLLAGGSALGRRIVGAAACGVATGMAASVVSWGLAGWDIPAGQLVTSALWRMFVLAVLSPIGAIVTELCLPEP